MPQKIEFSVFVSYAHEDEELANTIAKIVENTKVILNNRPAANRFKVWIDRQNIVAGSSWRKTILEGVKGCSLFIVLIPRQQSVYIALECGMAMALNKPIIPIAFSYQDIVAYNMDHIQSILFSRQIPDIKPNETLSKPAFLRLSELLAPAMITAFNSRNEELTI